MVPPAEELDVSVISYLIRNDSPYITNRYPVGRLPQFSRDGTIMDMGEEARNNRTFGDIGYGHCLFLNIPQSGRAGLTGLLAQGCRKTRPISLRSRCCAARPAARRDDHLVPQRRGMELPVAAALGHWTPSIWLTVWKPITSATTGY